MKAVRYHPIGVIRTPFRELEGMPIQPVGAGGVQGTVEVDARYREGLKDLRGFSHVILLYHFHRCRGFRLRVTPFLDRRARGVFATRAPQRPNPIGLSVVRLIAVRGGKLTVEGLDMLDETPLLDIKPYVPGFEASGSVRIGWLEKKRAFAARRRSDRRFAGRGAAGSNKTPATP